MRIPEGREGGGEEGSKNQTRGKGREGCTALLIFEKRLHCQRQKEEGIGGRRIRRVADKALKVSLEGGGRTDGGW